MSGLVEILLLLLSVFSPDPTNVVNQSTSTTAYVLAVADGDTILVAFPEDDNEAWESESRQEWVRYIGIDTPEEPREDTAGECWHDEATVANEALVADREVILVADQEDRDKFNRILRYVYVIDEMGVEHFVNEALISDGHARTLRIEPNTTHAAHFRELEIEAQNNELGRWGHCS